MELLIEYLEDGVTPNDEKESRSIKCQALWYILLDGQLYNKSFSLLPLKCLKPFEADYALRKVHQGICNNQLGGRSLAYKVFRQGYYWSTMMKEAVDFIQRCD